MKKSDPVALGRFPTNTPAPGSILKLEAADEPLVVAAADVAVVDLVVGLQIRAEAPQARAARRAREGVRAVVAAPGDAVRRAGRLSLFPADVAAVAARGEDGPPAAAAGRRVAPRRAPAGRAVAVDAVGRLAALRGRAVRRAGPARPVADGPADVAVVQLLVDLEQRVAAAGLAADAAERQEEREGRDAHHAGTACQRAALGIIVCDDDKNCARSPQRHYVSLRLARIP